MSCACRFLFKDLGLQRVDIKCRNTNSKSKAVAQRLHFTYNGVLSEAELGDEQDFDLDLFSLTKNND